MNPAASGTGDRASERGAVLMLVAIAMFVLLGAAAFAVDLGRVLVERRDLTGAVDAAALATARAYKQGDQGCDSVAQDYLTRNHPAATLLSCEFVEGDSAAWVAIEAQVEVDMLLAGVLGVQQSEVRVRAAAAFSGSDRVESGARPMGMCLAALEDDPIYQNWLGSTSESPPIRVTYDKSHPDACGDVSGNWGFIDFDGGANSNGDTKAWIEHGFPGTIELGWHEGDPGAFGGSHASALQSLVDSEVLFSLPVFTDAIDNGANAQFELTHFLGVRLVDFNATGRESSRFLEIVLHPAGLEPDCCHGSNPLGGRTSLVPFDDTGNPNLEAG